MAVEYWICNILGWNEKSTQYKMDTKARSCKAFSKNEDPGVGKIKTLSESLKILITGQESQ